MHDDLKDCVKLNKIRNHFICEFASSLVLILLILWSFLVSIESTGALPSDVLMIEAIKVLKNKCNILLGQINKCNKN